MKWLIALIVAHLAVVSIGARIQNKRVVIVGGGVAGLAACQRLVQTYGITDLVLLEAGSQLGGRVNSYQLNSSTYIDLGAQYVRGSDGNSIYNIFNSIGEIDTNTKTFTTSDIIVYATPNGTSLNSNLVKPVLDSIESSITNIAQSVGNISPLSLYHSIGPLLDQSFGNRLTSFGTSDYNLLMAIYRAKLGDRIKSQIGSADLNELSASSYRFRLAYSGDYFINLKTGFFKLIDYFNNQIGSYVRLTSPVRNIDWADPNKINLNMASGGPLRADFVIVTTSLGFLKQNMNSFFTPALPYAKRMSIKKLGYGVVDKIFLVFPKNIFSNGQKALSIYWSQDLPQLNQKYNLNGNKFYQGFTQFYVYSKTPNIMQTTLTGDDATYAENLSDSTLMNIMFDILSSSFPSLDLSAPIQIVRSKWKQNPYIQGSLPFYKIGSSDADLANIASALNNRVYFAGDALDSNNIGQVQGAYASGNRAADQVFAAINAIG